MEKLAKKSQAIQRKNGKKLCENHNQMVQLEKRFGKNRVFYFKENTIKKIGKFNKKTQNLYFSSWSRFLPK